MLAAKITGNIYLLPLEEGLEKTRQIPFVGKFHIQEVLPSGPVVYAVVVLHDLFVHLRIESDDAAFALKVLVEVGEGECLVEGVLFGRKVHPCEVQAHDHEDGEQVGLSEVGEQGVGYVGLLPVVAVQHRSLLLIPLIASLDPKLSLYHLVFLLDYLLHLRLSSTRRLLFLPQ